MLLNFFSVSCRSYSVPQKTLRVLNLHFIMFNPQTLLKNMKKNQQLIWAFLISSIKLWKLTYRIKGLSTYRVIFSWKGNAKNRKHWNRNTLENAWGPAWGFFGTNWTLLTVATQKISNKLRTFKLQNRKKCENIHPKTKFSGF